MRSSTKIAAVQGNLAKLDYMFGGSNTNRSFFRFSILIDQLYIYIYEHTLNIPN